MCALVVRGNAPVLARRLRTGDQTGIREGINGAPDPCRAQGDYSANYAKISIENPSCIGFTVWGLSDGAWYDFVPPFMPPNDPLIFDADLQPKPAVHGILEALSARRSGASSEAEFSARLPPALILSHLHILSGQHIIIAIRDRIHDHLR